ncbi:MAG: rhodanese-like domain-containing protein [Rubrivivax sp.]
MPADLPPAFVHSAFYRFVTQPDAQAAAGELRSLGATLGLHGAIVVATEGLNGAVSGVPEAVDAFEHALHSGAVLGGAARGLAFKRSPCGRDPFGRYKVVVKPEIVALGLPDFEALPAPDERDDSHVSPEAWRELITRDDVVVLDNRNHFEWRLGRFKGAVDPQVRHFRDFVAYVQAHAPQWRAEGRTVAMYCTGGIRCDKTAPWMRSLGLQVRQLDGGILNHFARLPDAQRDWEGECFVFDKRVAVDTALQETDTTIEAVFDPQDPGERWRLERARRLDAF